MFENIKNYNDLKTLFNVNDDIFNIYNYLKCCSRYGDGSRLIITPNKEASKDVFIRFQQENKVGSFMRNGNTFKISIKSYPTKNLCYQYILFNLTTVCHIIYNFLKFF